MDDRGTALIVGASRGLGLGLAAEYLRRGWTVIATQRKASPDLESLAQGSEGRLTIETVDVARDEQIEALRERLGDRTFDLLFLNAGIAAAGDLLSAPAAEVNAVMHANAFGPVKLARRFVDRVREGSGVIAFMSTGMGSIGDNTSGDWDAYRASKAAQNILARSLAVREAARHRLTVLSINPGWVQTDMGGPNARIDVETSVRGIADVIAERRGTGEHVFVSYDGSELPW